jgi:hypothetical protein
VGMTSVKLVVEYLNTYHSDDSQTQEAGQAGSMGFLLPLSSRRRRFLPGRRCRREFEHQ